jgi:phosphoribosylanthranilate isomerase
VSTRIKICGTRSWHDVELVIAAGADAFGMIFAPSPRSIEWSAAREIARRLPLDVAAVAVFTNPDPEDIVRVRGLFGDPIIQLSGDETPELARAIGGCVMKALHVGEESPEEIQMLCDRYAPALPLLDTKVAGAYGGSGKTFDWSRVAMLARFRPLMIAGGLTPENVGDCVRSTRPFGVDVRSGVETDGRINSKRVQQFVRAVRESDAA